MTREDHLALLADGVQGDGLAWADLGSGTGAFTLALAEMLEPAAEIYSIDRDRRALGEQERLLRARFPSRRIHYLQADLAAATGIPPLDGAVAANSLHYVRDLPSALATIRAMLRPGGRLLVVEYETGKPTPWIPYPLPFKRFRASAEGAGFRLVRGLATRRSSFGGTVYSAAAERAGEAEAPGY